MAVKEFTSWIYRKAYAHQQAAEARKEAARNDAVGNFVDLQAVADHLQANMDQSQPAAVIRETTSFMFGTHLDACTRYRNTATGRIDYAKVHAAERAALQEQDKVLQNLSDTGVMTINVQDHRFFKPLPKLGEIKKRRRRGEYSGSKYSARDVQRAAETDMVNMLEYSEMEDQQYLHRDDEGDRTVTRLLNRAREIRDEVFAPADDDAEFERMATLLAQVPPQNIVVLGRDNDLIAIDTHLERRWVITPHMGIREPPLFLRTQNVPQDAAAGIGVGKGGKASTTERRQLTVSLFDMDGVDRLLPLDLTRVDRAVLAALIGNDYSNGGVFGVGVNTILAGLVHEAHRVEWTLENVLAVRDALNDDFGVLNGSSREAERRRTTLGLHKSNSIVQVGEATVRGLVNAVDAALGRDVEMFDTREMPWVEHDNDDMRVRFNNGTRPPPRPYDAKGADKTFMYRRPVPGQPLAEQRRFPPSPSPFAKRANPLVPLRNSPMPRADDTSTEANRRRELARKIGSPRSSTIRITAISSGASLHAAMLRRASSERDGHQDGDEGAEAAKPKPKPKPKGGDERKSKRKGKRGGKRGKGKKKDDGAAVGDEQGGDGGEYKQEPPSEDKSDKSESRVRLDSQFDTVCSDPLRTRSVERTLHRDQIELRPPRDDSQPSTAPKKPSAPGSAKQRTRLASSGIPSSAPRVGGVFTGGSRPRANGPANVPVDRSDKPVADVLSLLSLSFALSTLEQNDVANEWIGACKTEADFSYLANKARGRDFDRDLARLMCGLGGQFVKGGGQGEGGTLKRVGTRGKPTTLDERHVVSGSDHHSRSPA